MSDDDSQNLSTRDYDDQGDEETLSASGGSSPSHSEDAFVVQTRPVEKRSAKAHPVVPARSAFTQVQSKKKRRHGESTSVKNTGPPVSKPSITSGEYVHLDPSGAFDTPVEMSPKDREALKDLLGGTVRYKVDESLTSIVDCHSKHWMGAHLDSLKGGQRFPLDPFLVEFVNYYGIVPGQVTPNGHRILACFPQICRRHHVPCSMELFNFLHSVKPMGKQYGSGFVMIQSRGATGKISGLPDSNRRWRNKFLRVRLDDEPPFANVWSEQLRKCELPPETSMLRTFVRRIGSERYVWEVYHSPDALKAAQLPAPSYEAVDQNATGGRSVGEIVRPVFLQFLMSFVILVCRSFSDGF